jgi:hypothetical protein
MKKKHMSQKRVHIRVDAVLLMCDVIPRLLQTSSSGSGAPRVSQVDVSWWCSEVEATAWSRRVLGNIAPAAVRGKGF